MLDVLAHSNQQFHSTLHFEREKGQFQTSQTCISLSFPMNVLNLWTYLLPSSIHSGLNVKDTLSKLGLFSAVHLRRGVSSMGALVTHWMTDSLPLLKNAAREPSERLETFETFDSGWWRDMTCRTKRQKQIHLGQVTNVVINQAHKWLQGCFTKTCFQNPFWFQILAEWVEPFFSQNCKRW